MLLSRSAVFPITLAGVCLVPAAAQEAARLSSVPPEGRNAFYAGNRAPLRPSALIKLPVRSIRADGWLRHQMELEAKGFSGRLTEISQFCRFEGNGWTNPKGAGRFGWEEVPYWLRGFIDLGYALGDERIMAEARRWVESVLATQRPNGYFGSQSNLQGVSYSWNPSGLDIWPNMVMLFPLRTLFEATDDARILPFMARYFRWQMTIPFDNLLPSSWQKWRAGDNLDSIYWLYNRTGDSWLLDLARINHERTADWSGGIPTWHVVNLAECFREPAQFFQQAGDIRYLKATERNYDMMRGIYGQVPGGLYGADENARPGFDGPRQGTETCAMAEMLYSDELLVGITGNAVWADRAEEIAFNSLPASMTPDLKGLHYLTAPNQIQLDRANKSPLIQNEGDMFSYNPYQYRCCQHNVAFAWPYYANHLWMAAQGNGIAAVLYAPSSVQAKVGDGTQVRIIEQTTYPFDETVNLTLAAPKPVRFPLILRIPGWCAAPRISVNGKPVALSGSGAWATIERTWLDGDRVRLELPMTVRATVWARNRNTVSIDRGPLTYSLRIGEKWQRAGGTDEWPGMEVYPTTPWNYGLEIDPEDAASSVTVERREGALPAQPFGLDAPPLTLRARGRRIPGWVQEPNGMVGEVQPGPVRSDAPLEEITLVPMGSARLRITAFPRIDNGPAGRDWRDGVPLVLASHSIWQEPPTAASDDVLPANSSDRSIPRFSWADHRGTVEWIEYRYSKARMLSSAEVYWAADDSGCQLPAGWRLLWWDGTNWQPVRVSSEYETARDRFSRVRFEPVTTMRLRLEARLRGGAGAGILEWRTE